MAAEKIDKVDRARVAKLVAALTPQELREVGYAAQHVWQSIGFDVLTETSSIPRAEVLELVLDADRLFHDLMANKVYKNSPALQALFKDKYKDQAMMSWLTSYLKKEVFTYARYGL